MTLTPFLAGSRITAAALNALQPLSAVKLVDESKTGTTFLADAELQIPILNPNATYQFQCLIVYSGSAQGAGDLKWEWSAPAGATMQYLQQGGPTTGGGSTAGFVRSIAGAAVGTNGSGNNQGTLMTGIIETTFGGTLWLFWAQNTNNTGTPTIIRGGSYIVCQQVA